MKVLGWYIDPKIKISKTIISSNTNTLLVCVCIHIFIYEGEILIILDAPSMTSTWLEIRGVLLVLLYYFEIAS